MSKNKYEEIYLDGSNVGYAIRKFVAEELKISIFDLEIKNEKEELEGILLTVTVPIKTGD